MKRAQYRAWLLGVSLVSLSCLEPVSATSPTFLIVYGDSVASPIVIQCNPDAPAEFLWNTSRGYAKHVENGSLQRHTTPDGLNRRPYLKVAIFWGRQDPTTKPEGASQHARLYFPTASEPAVVVATAITGDHQFSPRQIPEDLSGFLAGWVLKSEDLANARRLGFPGL